jgi:hypothetical protein
VRGDCAVHSAAWRKFGRVARRALPDDGLPKLSAANNMVIEVAMIAEES